ncbi:MAG: hypothetical protein IKD07_07245, partial [Clostridia bacterium]|nr:hypothetical protein [Clostridia bacterium]
MAEAVKEKKIVSYHTFLFPFLFEIGGVERKSFEKCLHPGWFPDVWDPKTMNTAADYNQYHYFNKAAHNAIYMTEDSDGEIVRNFRFDLCSLVEAHPTANREREWKRDKDDRNFVKYIIEKNGGDQGHAIRYSLSINAIRLHLYNTGVAILVFELENWDYPSENDVIRINDLGRRIYAPYYGIAGDRILCGTCADDIYFEIDGKRADRECSKLLSERLFGAADETVLAEPVKRLFTNDLYTIATKEQHGKNEFCIEPIIDDRMFVACYYDSPDFVDAMREWDGENYRFITDAKARYPFDNRDGTNTAHRLYRMMYIDGDDMCCHGRDMLTRLLSEDHVYTRWLENGWYEGERMAFGGSVTGISEYAVVSVAKNPPSHLVTSFLTEYVEMATLVLAQRASLLSFEYMISESANDRHYNVEMIQKKYTLFQCQILLQEITPQQQGIELYDLLEKSLMIEKEQAEIKEQIEGLFAQKNDVHDKRENTILSVLAVFGIFEFMDILFAYIFGALGSEEPPFLNWIELGVSALLIAVFLVLLFRKRTPKKWKHNRK